MARRLRRRLAASSAPGPQLDTLKLDVSTSRISAFACAAPPTSGRYGPSTPGTPSTSPTAQVSRRWSPSTTTSRRPPPTRRPFRQRPPPPRELRDPAIAAQGKGRRDRHVERPPSPGRAGLARGARLYAAKPEPSSSPGRGTTRAPTASGCSTSGRTLSGDRAQSGHSQGPVRAPREIDPRRGRRGATCTTSGSGDHRRGPAPAHARAGFSLAHFEHHGAWRSLPSFDDAAYVFARPE